MMSDSLKTLVQMEKISAMKDFLTCPVCLDTFKEPVSLTCHHSFCSKCLYSYWNKNSTRNCPMCRRKSSKEHLEVNFALKELIVCFSQKEEAPGGERPVMCTSHPEQTPLFCLDESHFLCSVCEFSLHLGHKVVTVDSGVSEKKGRLCSQQQSLFQKRDQAEFELLHRFLQQEEESALRALRQEQSRQTQTIEAQMVQIREELCTVEQNLLTVEDLLKKQNMDFLTQYRDTHKDRQTLLSQPSPQLRPGLLINQPKVLMRALVQYSPVILDPNTANRWLYVSEDLRGVRHGETEEQQVPDNPERFCKYREVQGSEGFSSGSHQWDVEVRWTGGVDVGVAYNRLSRGGGVSEGLLGQNEASWSLECSRGSYTPCHRGRRALECLPFSQTVGVFLDFEAGSLSFFCVAPGSMQHLHTFTSTFTEPLYPGFWLWSWGGSVTLSQVELGWERLLQ
uniref:Uncharacterized protein n=1 Tax=Periophthalmus magnuspinnatus TaxID=409849 RepID=A0A3B4A5U1_9GOBI